MADSRTPTLVDYSNALRHGWRILAVCAVLGGLGGASYGAFRVHDQFVVRVGVFTNQDFERTTAVLDLPIIPEFIPLHQRSKLESELPLTHQELWENNLIQVSSIEEAGALYISLTGEDPDRSIIIATEILTPIVEQQRAKFVAQKSFIRSALESTLNSLEERVASTAPTTDESSLFTTQAAWLSDYTLLAEARQQMTTLDSIEDSLTGGITEPMLVGEPAPTERNSTTSYAILGILFGLALGIPALVVRRFFDDRVLSVEDVSRLDFGFRVLGTFHRQTSWVQDDEGLSTTTALLRDLPSGQPTSIQFVELSSSGHLNTISADLISALDTVVPSTSPIALEICDIEDLDVLRNNLAVQESGYLVATSPALNDSGLGVVVGSATDRTVLVINISHDDQSAIAKGLAILDASGVVIEGTILIVG